MYSVYNDIRSEGRRRACHSSCLPGGSRGGGPQVADVVPGSGTRGGLAGSGVSFPRRAAALRVWVRKPRDSLPQSFGDKLPQVAPAENSAHTPASSGGRRYRGAPRRSGKLDVGVRPVPGARGGFWNPALAMGPSSRLDRSLRPLAARPFRVSSGREWSTGHGAGQRARVSGPVRLLLP